MYYSGSHVQKRLNRTLKRKDLRLVLGYSKENIILEEFTHIQDSDELELMDRSNLIGLKTAVAAIA